MIYVYALCFGDNSQVPKMNFCAEVGAQTASSFDFDSLASASSALAIEK